MDDTQNSTIVGAVYLAEDGLGCTLFILVKVLVGMEEETESSIGILNVRLRSLHVSAA